MTCRRKTKSERELVADIKKSAMIFCNNYHKNYGCYDCPLEPIQKQYKGDCNIAYVHYILEEGEE